MPEDHDPYSTAITKIVEALEEALDDGVSGQMSHGEFETLEHIAKTLSLLDTAVEISPRAA